MRSKKSVSTALAAAFAALYAVGVVVLAPISFQLVQVRVADALLPLSIIFGWPAVLGLAFGTFVANLPGGLGPVDIFGGSIANLIASYVAWRVALNKDKKWIPMAIGLEMLIITLIVGTYLSYVLAIPLQIALLGVMLGSIIAIGFLGSIILYAFSTEHVSAVLRGHGIPVCNRTYQRQTKRPNI